MKDLKIIQGNRKGTCKQLFTSKEYSQITCIVLWSITIVFNTFYLFVGIYADYFLDASSGFKGIGLFIIIPAAIDMIVYAFNVYYVAKLIYGGIVFASVWAGIHIALYLILFAFLWTIVIALYFIVLMIFNILLASKVCRFLMLSEAYCNAVTGQESRESHGNGYVKLWQPIVDNTVHCTL